MCRSNRSWHWIEKVYFFSDSAMTCSIVQLHANFENIFLGAVCGYKGQIHAVHVYKLHSQTLTLLYPRWNTDCSNYPTPWDIRTQCTVEQIRLQQLIKAWLVKKLRLVWGGEVSFAPLKFWFPHQFIKWTYYRQEKAKLCSNYPTLP